MVRTSKQKAKPAINSNPRKYRALFKNVQI